MSKARKCDRCGAFFDVPDGAMTVSLFDIRKEHGDYLGSKDLCSSCWSELEKWLEEGSGE